MKERIFIRLLSFLFLAFPLSMSGQTKPESDNSFYLGFSPLDLLQGNIRVEPGFNYLNLRLSMPLNIYCLPEVSSRFTNRYSRKSNVGSGISRNEKGDILRGIGLNFRPVFLLKSDYGSIEESKFTFISFSVGIHFLTTETRGMGYMINTTPDGKEYYAFGETQGTHKFRMIPLRFTVGKEIPVFKKYRLSYWVGIGHSFFLNQDAFIDKYSKSSAMSGIYYNKTPYPVFGLQIGKNFLFKR
ncbi:MAG TPA: hypothetical protein DIW47_06555 [Bacteroidetes bacterium]|nr:hypothetical protein [Bacteroidota bacterium]